MWLNLFQEFVFTETSVEFKALNKNTKHRFSTRTENLNVKKTQAVFCIPPGILVCPLTSKASPIIPTEWLLLRGCLSLRAPHPRYKSDRLTVGVRRRRGELSTLSSETGPPLPPLGCRWTDDYQATTEQHSSSGAREHSIWPRDGQEWMGKSRN